FLPDGIPITGVLGDQQAALFGQAGINKGDSKCTYGTGAFYLMNIGDEVSYSENGLLTTVAYRENGKDYFALEGSCYIAGAAVQWLRDKLDFFPESKDVEEMANKATEASMENIIFLPYFTGLGTPHWISDAQAAIVGLTRDSGKEQISRACLEGICLSINELIEVVEKDSGLKVEELKVDGGAVANNMLNQMQANFSNTKIIRPEVIETTAFGAASAAAIGKGIFKKETLIEKWKEDRTYLPSPTEYNKKKMSQWKNLTRALYLNR
ncbi:MAG: FGGY-family carbohydrate kinase, partial [Halobacteriovoraceae bacterium]|nr:FGGY-family carbohydrate kinase [Halobacteriovoraceae bacterium]